MKLSHDPTAPLTPLCPKSPGRGKISRTPAAQSGKPRLPVKIGLLLDDSTQHTTGGVRGSSAADPSLAGMGGGAVFMPTLETFGVKLVAGTGVCDVHLPSPRSSHRLEPPPAHATRRERCFPSGET